MLLKLLTVFQNSLEALKKFQDSLKASVCF